MLLIDRRERDILSWFEGRGVEVAVVEMDFSDCSFFIHGPAGPDSMHVGIERKKIDDIIRCITDQRLSGYQLQGLCQNYDRVYIFLESMIRPGQYGEIEVYKNRAVGWKSYYPPGQKRTITYRTVMSHLTSLEQLCAEEYGVEVRVRRTSGAQETVENYLQLYHWGQTPWEDHESHKGVYITAPTLNGRVKQGKRVALTNANRVRMSDVTYAWAFAAQIDGIDKKAREVAGYFKSAKRMALASKLDWMQVAGIGEKLAEECVRAFREDGARSRRRKL